MGIDPNRFKRDKGKVSDDAWAEWLTNEAPAASVQQELRQKRVERANTYTSRPVVPETPVAKSVSAKPAAGQPASGVSIQINIPEWRKPQFKRAKAAWRFARE